MIQNFTQLCSIPYYNRFFASDNLFAIDNPLNNRFYPFQVGGGLKIIIIFKLAANENIIPIVFIKHFCHFFNDRVE